MKALVVKGISELEVMDIPKPNYKDDEVLIKVKNCGICGSDIPRALNGGVHQFPIVLGHEFSGDIVEIGSKVTKFKVSDRVTVAPLKPCESCEFCKKGMPAMCMSYGFIGSRENGAMAEYIAVKEGNVVLLPDGVSYEEGAMIEPITVALHGIERVNIKAGSTVLIFGAGTIGLLVLQCLKARGVGKTYMVDIDDNKLEIAKQMGAEAINSLNVNLNEYLTENGKPDIVYENSGSAIAQAQALEVVNKLGKVVYIGTSTRDVTLKPEVFEKILRGEILITGSWMSYSEPYPGYEWTTAAQYIRDKKIDLKPMITHKFSLSDGIKPFKKMIDRNELSIKIMFEI